jgi:hypothetical protein
MYTECEPYALRLLDAIQDQCDTPAEEPSADDGREQLNQLEAPHRPRSLHRFPNAALQHDHSQGHGGADNKPPEKHFERRPHKRTSKLHSTVKTTVLNRFRYMQRFNFIRAREIGNGSRYADNAPMSAGRQAQFGQRLS